MYVYAEWDVRWEVPLDVSFFARLAVPVLDEGVKEDSWVAWVS